MIVRECATDLVKHFITVIEILGFHSGNRLPRQLYISVHNNSQNQQCKRVHTQKGCGVTSYL